VHRVGELAVRAARQNAHDDASGVRGQDSEVEAGPGIGRVGAGSRLHEFTGRICQRPWNHPGSVTLVVHEAHPAALPGVHGGRRDRGDQAAEDTAGPFRDDVGLAGVDCHV